MVEHRDYFKEAEYVLESVWFDYYGGRYRGRGVMSWNPDKGFHIDAPVDRDTAPLKRIEFGRAGVFPKNKLCTIFMKPRGFDKAIVPHVRLVDRQDLIDENRLSSNLSSVLFVQTDEFVTEKTMWIGSALYETIASLNLPDSVRRETLINEHSVVTDPPSSGIWYEDDNKKIIGCFIDDTHFELHWKFSKSCWSKAECWRWAEAARDTLSFCFGQTIRLLERRLRFGHTECLERIREKKVDSLQWFLHPYEKQSFHLDKTIFLKLTEFYARNEPHADVCRKVFNQIAEASSQKSHQALELLLATILEAVLRTASNDPFVPDKRGWPRKKRMEEFCTTFLSTEWTVACERALRVHTRLRNRNAHPDWITGHGGSLSEAKLAETLDDMIFLSRFYGYMVLALAGIEDLKPQFPRPHKEWSASLTIEHRDAGK